MKRVNTICMSALLLGAAAIAAPAFAQAATDDAIPSAKAANPNNNANAALPGNTVERMGVANPNGQANAQTAANNSASDESATASTSVNGQPSSSSQTANADTSISGQGSSQTAMNSSGSSADANMLGKTSKKYSRKNRRHDFAREQAITKQLNQQASNASPNQQTASAL